MIVETVFALIYVVAAGLLLWSRGTLNSFVEETRRIRDSSAMERFKALARTQMHLALLMAGLLTSGMVVGFVLVSRYGLAGLGVVVLTNLVVVGLAVLNKKVEARVRNLPTASDDLARELQRVSESWEKKALPDF